MDIAHRIVERFIALPLEKRRLYLEKMRADGISPANLPIPAVRSENAVIPLSYAQERQWFLWQMEPDSAAYHIATALSLRGPLDIDALERSFNALIARHESLRTTFTHHAMSARQVIQPQLRVHIIVHEVGAGASTAQIDAFIERESRQPFDLQSGPLLRVGVLRVSPQEHVLLLVQHHIVSDGWSMHILVEELALFYTAFSQNQEASLPGLPIQFADYAIWQRSWMEAGERERQLAYWQTQLGGEQPVLALPTDHARPALSSYRGARFDLAVPPALTQSLRALARSEGVTLFTLLLAAFHCVLYRYSGQSDIRIGTPVANRNRVETERLLGFFVNTQVLKANIDGQARFTEFLQQVNHTALDAQAHQDLPFEQLVEALQPERSLNRNPLFQVMFNHQVAQRQAPTPLTQLRIEPLAQQTHTAQLDLTLEVFESATELNAFFIYATDLFKGATIERLARHWQTILHSIVDDPRRRIAALRLLGPAEQQIIVDWNRTQAAYPDQCIQTLIEIQAAKTPAATALVFNGQPLTYAELNGRANRLAHRLIELGVRPETRVGIAVERSLEMVIGLLAILKAGGAYVPLDPEYPRDRLAYMMDDSGITLLLTQAHLLHRLPFSDAVTPLSLQADDAALHGYSAVNPHCAGSGNQLAYLIYTSGSTGKPKGVMVRHAALTNFINSMAKAPGLQSTDRLLSLTTFSFDIFGLEMYLPLSIGARVVLASNAVVQDSLRALDLIEAEQITVVQATPSIWRVLLDSDHASLLRGCKIFCGGEALPDELASRMLELGGEAWNLYGPTETTIWSAVHRIGSAARPLLGRPIDNTALYVVDVDGAPAPPGATGELLIGGDGLARGYHQRPALTAERFLPNPFAEAGERIYRTGDLARQCADGSVDYLGRIDHQIKIHGFRIELGEIEAQLQEDTAVREALVIAQEAAHGPQLVGYVVPRKSLNATDADAQTLLRDHLKTALKARLPAYMVPTHLLFLEKFPLTPNGKLDRKALPPLDAKLLQKVFVAPRSEWEQSVAAIWQDVLKLECIGLADNFFELGGHSLLAMQVTVRLREQLHADVPIKTLFIAANLGEFCELAQASGARAQSVQDALIKSLADLKRLSVQDIENLLS